jgi:hypothetical protein
VVRASLTPTAIYLVASCPDRAALMEAIGRCGLRVSSTIGARNCDVVVGQQHKPWERHERAHVASFRITTWSVSMLNVYLAAEQERIAAGGKTRIQMAKDLKTTRRSAVMRQRRASSFTGKPDGGATTAGRRGGPALSTSQRQPLFSCNAVREIPQEWGTPAEPSGTFDEAARVKSCVNRIAGAVRATVEALTSAAYDRVAIEVAVWMTSEQRQRWRRYPHVLMRTYFACGMLLANDVLLGMVVFICWCRDYDDHHHHHHTYPPTITTTITTTTPPTPPPPPPPPQPPPPPLPPPPPP